MQIDQKAPVEEEEAIEREKAYELRRLENVLTTVVITLVSAID